jgi:hypothetical protein
MRHISMIVTFALALAACAVEAPREIPDVAAQTEALSSEEPASYGPDETSYPQPKPPLAGAPSAPQCAAKGESCTTTGGKPDVSCCDGTACVPIACNNSIPQRCFGTCRAPSPPKPQPVGCFTSSQCAEGLICSTELGDCRRPPCAPGRVCPAVCAGVCVAPK